MRPVSYARGFSLALVVLTVLAVLAVLEVPR
jgi:Tfp pilus assembly protein FimT